MADGLDGREATFTFGPIHKGDLSMSQPEWELVAQLGDKSPIDYGGYFIYWDKTGVYPEEVVILETNDECEDKAEWTAYRFILERCTFTDGVLSDNKYHPDKPAWFANKIESVADSIDASVTELISMFCSDNPIERAHAYKAIGEYYGMANLDDYPVHYRTRHEVEERFGVH
jgi:hypothetical protein